MAKHVCQEIPTVQYVYTYTCDACKKEIPDTQETLHWSMIGGYSSIFGDGARMSLDLCQECIKDKLGAVIRFLDDEELEVG